VAFKRLWSRLPVYERHNPIAYLALRRHSPLAILGAVLLVLPIIFVLILWALLPWLLAPASTPQMPAVSTSDTSPLIRRIEDHWQQAARGSHLHVDLTTQELNTLLAHGLVTSGAADRGVALQLATNPDQLRIYGVLPTSEGQTTLARGTRGRPVGLDVLLRGRVEGSTLVFRVEDVSMGRIGVPTFLALAALHSNLGLPGIVSINASKGELRMDPRALLPDRHEASVRELFVQESGIRVHLGPGS